MDSGGHGGEDELSWQESRGGVVLRGRGKRASSVGSLREAMLFRTACFS